MKNTLLNDPVESALERLIAWIDHSGVAGFDPCDVGGHPILIAMERHARRGGSLATPLRKGRRILLRLPKPFMRRVLRIRPETYPQAMGNLAAGWTRLAGIRDDSRARARRYLDWLVEHPSPQPHGIAWGQPYDWVSKEIIPKYTPRTTVTSICGHAFLDAYECWGAERDLEVARSACEFVLKGLNRTFDQDGDFCFSYSPVDHQRVHNANMDAAGLLARTWLHTKEQILLDTALAATRYTLKHQMADGAWEYRGPPDPLNGVIDGYHTGFVIEALGIVVSAVDSAAIETALARGLDFYRKALFEADGLPRTTTRRTYPVNVQSAAQGIITFTSLVARWPKLLVDAERVAMWVIAHMQAEDGHFGHYYFQDGRVDWTPSIRWSDSWMLRALAALVAIRNQKKQQ